MGGEDYRPIVGNLVELVDEHCAHGLQPFNDEAVVDDFMTDVDGRAKALECQLDDLDRAVDSCTKAPRGRNDDTKRRKFTHGAGHVRHRLQA
jgi:hypothetical protein